MKRPGQSPDITNVYLREPGLCLCQMKTAGYLSQFPKCLIKSSQKAFDTVQVPFLESLQNRLDLRPRPMSFKMFNGQPVCPGDPTLCTEACPCPSPTNTQ